MSQSTTAGRRRVDRAWAAAKRATIERLAAARRQGATSETAKSAWVRESQLWDNAFAVARAVKVGERR